MILYRLVIYSIVKEEIIKKYTFNKVGLNIILGSKKDSDDESNGVGKTSMVESIRYLLGEKIPKEFQNRGKLVDANIMMVLETIENEKSVFLGRVLSEEKKGYIKYGGDMNFNLDNWVELKDKEYKEEIENLIFKDKNSDSRPSFASIREYILRDEKTGFNDIVLPNRKAIINYEILNYLFQLDGKGEESILQLKKKQEELDKQLKLIETLSGDITEIRIKEKELEKELEELLDISKTLDIKENVNLAKNDYRDLKKEYNDTCSKIIKLENMKEQYETNINNLKETVNRIKELDDVKSFYNQIIEYFPQKLSKNYSEILEYYQFMVNSRGKYFGDKIDKISLMLENLEEKKINIEKRMNAQLNTLQSTTVVNDINNIIERIYEKNQELANVRVRLDQYSQKENITKKINDLKQEIIKQTNIRNEIFNSYREITQEAEKMFNEIVYMTYEEKGVLQFEFNGNTNMKNPTARIKIACSIIDENSHGRMYMKINMFDLTWLLQRIKQGQTLQFLFHDGSYVKPDNKKAKIRLLSYIDKVMLENAMGQYFITLNVDELEENDIKTLIDMRKVIAFLSKEKDEDRFMGMKYV